MYSLNGDLPLNPASLESSLHKIDTNTSNPLGQVNEILHNRFACEFTGNMNIGCNLVIMPEGKPYCILSAGHIQPNDTQHWGSVSKQFTAACITQLVGKGLLKWDDDIREVCPDLPEFRLNGEVQKVTVDDLLHMRSGLPDFYSLALISGNDPEKLENTDILDLLNKHPGLIYAPGSQETYCNTNYTILAKITENVAKNNHLLEEHETFRDFVRENVFLPHDMQARCTGDKITSIRGFDDKQDCTTESPAFGSAGVIGTPEDMAKWNTALSNKELDPLIELPKGTSMEPNKPTYCRGLIVTDLNDYRRIHHGGNISGFVTIYRRYENAESSKTFALFLATNYDNIKKAEDLANEVANTLAGTRIEGIEHMEKTERLMEGLQKEAKEFEGTYLCKEFNAPWDVQIKEDAKNVWVVHMSPAGNTSAASLSFSPMSDSDGNLIFQSSYAGQIQKNTEGFVYIGGKIAPVHFEKIN